MKHPEKPGRSVRDRMGLLAVLAMVPLLAANTGCPLPIRWDFTLNVTPNVPITDAVVFAKVEGSNDVAIQPVPDLPGRVMSTISFSDFFPFDAPDLRVGLLGTYDNNGQTGLTLTLDGAFQGVILDEGFQTFFQGVDESQIIGALQSGAPQDSTYLKDFVINQDSYFLGVATNLGQLTYDTSGVVGLFSQGHNGGSVSLTATAQPPANVPEPSPAIPIALGLLFMCAAAGVARGRRHRKIEKP
ncbi:MAG TPA: hypothetical protein VGZ73_32600 [Bryobacteraceae bacterium]|jgi:hypothetical protein|nr:hypothetical protein [Bryobacteraceae bacterium]